MKKGILYVVATPIGNLKDITKRAIEILSSVEIIACEDTRTTGNLLSLLEIPHGKLFSYYRHRERDRTKVLIEYLNDGKDIALVSDAGTPNVSDPGIAILREAYRNNIRIIPIPGASSLCTAISVSPFGGEYLFISFLPKGETKLYSFFEKFSDREENLIFFQSPKRVLKTFEILSSLFPERNILTLKELTKLHEEIILDTIKAQHSYFKNLKAIKGEYVFILEGRRDKIQKREKNFLIEKYLILKKEGYSLKESAKIISLLYGFKKNEVYELLLEAED